MPCLPTLPAPCWPRCGRFHRAALAAGCSLTESRWLDVLHDPRARWRTEKRLSATGRYAHLRLDRWRRPMMTLTCRLCGVHKSFDTEQVMKQFGEDYNIKDCGTIPCHASGAIVITSLGRATWSER